MEWNQIYKVKMYSRFCPECKEEIKYINLRSFKNANAKNTLCLSCVKKGNKNPFFHKIHTKESKDKIRDFNLGKTYSEEINLSKGRLGKTAWNKDKKMPDGFSEKVSKNSSGKNNPMFGKPSPMGSGNGWSGWYKGWYFRSLKELSFMINYIERFGFKWETGENKKYQIKYTDNEKERNYYPDFLIDQKYLVEVKPKKLWNSRYVKLKKEAAIKFCEERGLKYKLIDPMIISKEKLMKIEELKFLEKYQIKFENYES